MDVICSQSGATLDKLFHYLYPGIWPAPLTTDLPFDDISKVTQAIEKYQLSNVGEFWNEKLLNSATKTLLAALGYAAHVGNEELLRHVAPLVAQSNTPMYEVLLILPQALWGKWFGYHEELHFILRTAIGSLPEYDNGAVKLDRYCSCARSFLTIRGGAKQPFPSARMNFLRKLGSTSSIVNLDMIDDYVNGMSGPCMSCGQCSTTSSLRAWRDRIRSLVDDTVHLWDLHNLNPPESSSTQTSIQTSGLFAFDDADITISSFDGVRFHLHRKNLEVCCGAFPPSSHPTMGEVVYLTESGSALEALFQFIYPRQQPDWDEISFPELYELAEAAEKYQVFGAMSVCKILIKRFVRSDTAKVFAYSSKHGYDALANQTALILLKSGANARDGVGLLTPTAFLAWVRYVEHARSLCRKAISSAPEVAITMLQVSTGSNTSSPSSSCPACKLPLFKPIENPFPIALKELGTSSIDVLQRFDEIWRTFDEKMKAGTPTEAFQQALTKWRDDVRNDIKSIPAFTTFL